MVLSSVFLAKSMGLFFAAMGIGLILNGKHFLAAAKEIQSSHASQLIAGVVPLLLGSFLVSSHNIWVSHWTVLVTIVSWLFLISGLYRLWFSEHWVKTIKAVTANASGMNFMGVVVVILGFALLYFGHGI